jgi:Ca2+-binding RTX toxin-like protein
MTNTGTFDASLLTGTATINANLVTQSVVINTGITGFPTLTLGVTGIGNVIGTANNDTITGNDHDNNLAGGNGDDILTGNGGNDTVSGGTGNDTLIGGTGNDSLDGGTGNDTADYSSIGQAITLKQTGVVTKGTAGTDQLVNVENIIGATGRTNIIDASTATGTATINVNLATNSVVFNNAVFVIGPSVSVPTLTFGVTNFSTVIGTVNNDTIAGDNANNTLIGNAGNDTLNGGGGNDQIFGDVTSAITAPIFTYNGKFYFLSSAGSWTQAQAQAVSLGGNLVAVNDAAENQFLVNTFGGTERLWIGLTDEVTEGTFKWVNGEAVTYTNWYPNQPDNAGGNEDYAEFNVGGAGKWNDLPNSALLLRGIIEIANSNDTIIGSTGNDTINGGIGQDTADYSAIGQAITLLPTGTVTKGTAGTDQLVNVENIIGATGLTNIIDASTATGTATINANLATKSLVVNTGVITFPTLTFGVTNFVTVIGTANNDTITGDNGNNTLIGNAGNDILTGNGGNDTVSGGNGNDTLVGGIGDDSLDGGANTDTADYSAIGQAITLKPTGVVTKGTAGTDQLVNVENIIGATGLTNIIDASTATGTATINANLATKSLIVNTGVSAVFGPSVSVSTLTFGVTNFATLIGTANNDTLTGDDGNNTLIGNGGNDILTGNGGNDTVSGGTGNDAINGGLGSDTVDYSSFTEAITLLASGIVNKGSFGTDTIVGVETVIGATGQSNTIDASTGTATTTSLNVNLGNNSLIVNGLPSPINSITLNVQNFLNVYGTTQNDTITGNNLSNLLAGNAGNDTIQGNDGDDGLFGGDGNDSLLGGVGQDVLLGEFGNDFLFGEVGNDLLFGDDGNDQLYGGDGLDELYGGIGADSLYGGNDNDILWGEDGNDILNGGNGNDIFVIVRGSADIVQDFQDGFDRIGLGGGLLFSQLTISSLGTNTLIRSSGQILATLQNVSSTLITNTDFTVV